MVTFSQSRWGLRAVALLVWALVAGSVAYWGLRLSRAAAMSAHVTPTVAAVAIDSLAVARVLGATPAQAAPQASFASRFALQGVVAGSPGGGAALISIDGKPAKPFRVGSLIEDDLVLQSATARQATLAATRDGPALATIEMPALKN